MPKAALHGSSHYDLPPELAHRQYRRALRAPFVQPYLLLPARQVLRDHPGLRDIGRIALGQSIG
jgi:hypothetical protein